MEIISRLDRDILLSRVTEDDEDFSLGSPRYYAMIPLEAVPDSPGASFKRRWELTLDKITSERFPKLAVSRRPRGNAKTRPNLNTKKN